MTMTVRNIPPDVIEASAFREAMRHLVGGVSVITAGSGETRTGLTVTSAMNAIAHAMEAFYAPDRNPVIELMGKDAMAAFRDSLQRLLIGSQTSGGLRGLLCKSHRSWASRF